MFHDRQITDTGQDPHSNLGGGGSTHGPDSSDAKVPLNVRESLRLHLKHTGTLSNFSHF